MNTSKAQSGPIETDVAARMAQIVGQPPRVRALTREQLSDEQLAMISGIRTSAAAGADDEIPEFFLVAAKHPPLFQCQLQAGIMYFNGTICARERELAILRVGWLCQAPFEWGEHVDIAQRCGVTAEEVERVTQGSAAPDWNEHDAAILRGVEELLADHFVSDTTWAILALSWSEQQLMEFPMLVGSYFGTALQQNSLRMRLGPNNPGLDHR